jgi:hypothetical protein
MIPKPDKTCALVVGVANYDMGKGWELRGALKGAADFKSWLVGKELRPDRIYDRPNATTNDLQDVLVKIKEEAADCDFLIIYWAGHGFETELESRGLFLSDAREIVPRAVRIDDIIAFFRNEAPQFRTQWGFFDACATGRSEKAAAFESIHMDRALPHGPSDCRFVLATPSGLDVAYPRDGEPSVFAAELLGLVKEVGQTIETLLTKLETKHPVFVRDGRSRFWSECRPDSSARDLENHVVAIGGSLDISDARWRTEARRIDSGLDQPNASFRDIIERIAGWEPSLAERLCVALLLRGGHVANAPTIRDKIRDSPILGPRYQQGKQIIENLTDFENPVYIIKTAFGPKAELGATSVSFWPGGAQSKLLTEQQWDEAVPFADAIEIASSHMQEHEISSRAVIQILAPPFLLLDPPSEILSIEQNYSLVYRESIRAFRLECYRTLRAKLHDVLLDVKGRASRSFKVEWFSAVDDQMLTTEFPALRTGNCEDAEGELKRLLESLLPFAAVTRRSICSIESMDEDGLAEAIVHAPFAKIPQFAQKSRHKPSSILPHLTILWDDPEFPRGYC